MDYAKQRQLKRHEELLRKIGSSNSSEIIDFLNSDKTKHVLYTLRILAKKDHLNSVKVKDKILLLAESGPTRTIRKLALFVLQKHYSAYTEEYDHIHISNLNKTKTAHSSGQVYFLQHPVSLITKIGCSANLKKRKHDLDKILNTNLVLIASLTLSDYENVEKRFHKHFKAFRVNKKDWLKLICRNGFYAPYSNEWFYFPDSILSEFRLGTFQFPK